MEMMSLAKQLTLSKHIECFEPSLFLFIILLFIYRLKRAAHAKLNLFNGSSKMYSSPNLYGEYCILNSLVR